jgi:hypothetical protein
MDEEMTPRPRGPTTHRHEIPLSAPTRQILAAIRAEQAKGSDRFPNTSSRAVAIAVTSRS